MNIGILGTGTVGQTIGAKLLELGHAVCMGSRTSDNEKAKEFASKDPLRSSAGTFATAAAFGEIIFNCTAGAGSLEAVLSTGDGLKNKILIDLANPLDFSNGMPPTLSVCNTGSLGESIQSALPHTQVVKALNTTWCGSMVNPGMINNGDHHTFICGNDALAKDKVNHMLQSFGWKESHILDLGDLTAARGMEMYLPLWLRIYGTTKNGAFNIQIVS